MSRNFFHHCSILSTILWHYNRRRELQRLSRWAKYKKLPHPLRLYCSRLEDEEHRLNRYQLQYPKLALIAYLIYCLNKLCFPPPRYPQRGIARGYTRHAQFQQMSDSPRKRLIINLPMPYRVWLESVFRSDF